MQLLTLRAFRLLLRIILRAKAFNFVHTLEHEIQMEQGKGWGAGSIEVEVGCVIELSKRFGFGVQHFFDIGAYHGEYTVEILRRVEVRKVVSFEPMKANFKEMKKRIGDSDKVVLVNEAVGAPGKKMIYAENNSSFLGSFYMRSDFVFEEPATVVSGKKLILKYGAPDFVKIDVEGAEIEVINSFGESLNEIKLLQFEFGPPNIESRTFFREFWEFFQHRGWKLFCISRNGPIPISSYTTQLECFKTTNFLAVNVGLIESHLEFK